MTTETRTRQKPIAGTRRPPRADSGDPGSPVSTTLPPRVPSRRNPKWVALGVVALCLGALLSYVSYSRVAHQLPVVAVVNTVHRGSTIQAKDLTMVDVSSESGARLVPASELPRLVGRKAVYDLVGGSFLPPGAASDALVPATGRALVGVRLVAGRAPAGELPPSVPVRLVALPPSGADPGFSDSYTGDTVTARVISQEEGADGASIIVNVDVPASQAPMVALLSSQERLALVRDADR